MTDDVYAKAVELIESIEFDVNGVALPTAFAGGHGGLTSDKTLRLKDELRVLLSRTRLTTEGSSQA